MKSFYWSCFRDVQKPELPQRTFFLWSSVNQNTKKTHTGRWMKPQSQFKVEITEIRLSTSIYWNTVLKMAQKPQYRKPQCPLPPSRRTYNTILHILKFYCTESGACYEITIRIDFKQKQICKIIYFTSHELNSQSNSIYYIDEWPFINNFLCEIIYWLKSCSLHKSLCFVILPQVVTSGICDIGKEPC